MRSDIEFGTPVEVAYIVPLAIGGKGESKTVTGRFRGWHEDGLRVGTGRGIRTFPSDRVRYCSPISSDTIARRFKVGDRAYVQKYGSGYVGTVTKVGRTRVTVAIRLQSGRTREHAHNAADVSA